MPRAPKPRRDRDPTLPASEEIATYLMNEEEIATMSSHFVMQVTSRQLRRAGGAETKRQAATGMFYRE